MELAMDVDVITKVYKAMTDEERTELIKKGLCFQCQKGGHLSQDCPEKKGKATTSQPTATIPTPTSAVPKKMMAKELTAHIQSLMALLNDDKRPSSMTRPSRRVFDMENRVDVGLS